MYHRHIGILLAVIIILAGCSSIPTSPGISQLSRGQSIYQQDCAISACHGENGEGISNQNGFSVWPLVGKEFQRRNPNAQVVYDIVRSGGEAVLRALTDQQIYDAIAYELSLNSVDLTEPLVAQNASFISTGTDAKKDALGTLFPTPGNVVLVSTWNVPVLPASVENGDFSLRVTQMALASSIVGVMPPNGERFLLLVFTLDILTDQPLEVGPEYLRLVTNDGQSLEPLDIRLDYPIALFHSQTIEFEHGTSALAVFSLLGYTNVSQLRYTLPEGLPIILDLSFRS